MKDKREPTHVDLEALAEWVQNWPDDDDGGSTPEKVLGNLFRLTRNALEMSQEEVASKMQEYGHSWRQTTVAKTEAGARPIRVNEVVSFARISGLHPGVLIDVAAEDAHEDARKIALGVAVDRARQLVAVAEQNVMQRRQELTEAEATYAALVQEIENRRQALMKGVLGEDGEHQETP